MATMKMILVAGYRNRTQCLHILELGIQKGLMAKIPSTE
ncbi:Hypothetical protein Cp3995_1237 [Corynebacterium pseudotuberculosis 3/99-5]|nr:Hypothetical protein Cp3995_1237 [Corynebacterium pseudotuberculosis 3/99-5]